MHNQHKSHRFRSNVVLLEKLPLRPLTTTHPTYPSHTCNQTSVSSPGNLPLHHQAVERTGRHQESSVQQILLPPRGLELILPFIDPSNEEQAANWRMIFSCVCFLESDVGKVLQYMLWAGGLQWDLHPAVQNTVFCYQVSSFSGSL